MLDVLSHLIISAHAPSGARERLDLLRYVAYLLDYLLRESLKRPCLAQARRLRCGNSASGSGSDKYNRSYY